MEPSDTSPSKSDAGGVSARQGFKYQDHVAASFFIKMISNEKMESLECETADDIFVVWRGNPQKTHEYIQVKTTEDNSKWTQAEVLKRTNPKTESSIAEASLLCDKYDAVAWFRIVSKRDVNKSLKCLEMPFSKRFEMGDIDELASKIFAKRKSTISAKGNTLEYWGKNTFWEVMGTEQAVKNNNLVSLSEVSNDFGAVPEHSLLKTIYNDILMWVEKAANASRKTEPELKTITRSKAISW